MRAAFAVTAGVLCGAAVASADPEAKRMFDEGRRLLDQGKVEEACRRFAQSLEGERAAGTMLNLGECAERDGELTRAWSLYDEAAREYERTKKAASAKFARGRADALEPKLATLIVRVADPDIPGLVVRIGGEDVTPIARISRFHDPGKLTIRARAPGRATFETTVEGVAGEKITVDVPALTPRTDAPEPIEPGMPPPRRGPWSLVLGISVGAGVIGGATWIYGWREIKAAERGLCPPDPQFACGPVSTDDRERYISQGSTGRTLTYVGIGVVAVSAVAVGVSAYMRWGRGGRPGGRAQARAGTAFAVAPVVSPSEIGVAMSASF